MWQRQEYEMPSDVLFARPTNRAIKSGMVYKNDMQYQGKRTKKNRFALLKVQILISGFILIVILLIKALMPSEFSLLQHDFYGVMSQQLTQQDLANITADIVAQNTESTQNNEQVVQDTNTQTEQQSIVTDELTPQQQGQGSMDVTYEKFISNPASETHYELNVDVISPLQDCMVTSEFGERVSPITGEPEFHSGLDLASAEGSAVMVVSAGEIIAVDYDSISGNYVKVDHGDGFESVYGHLDSHSVVVGDVVDAGDEIGIIGTTGASTGIHLHLTFILYGIRVNPMHAYPDDFFI